MESLQSNTFIQVVASCRVKEFCSHLGMSAIATSLWGELRSLLHDYLPNNDLDSLYSEDKKVNFMREVNSFIGWAIGNLHWSLVDELNETESEAEEAVLQARLDFVSRMRYLDHQEAQDKTLHWKMLWWNLPLVKLWRLILVSPPYFEFSKSLMHGIVNSPSTKNFDIVGSDAVNKGWDHIGTKRSSLKRQFMEWNNSFTAISMREKEAILNQMVEKTCNAWQSCMWTAENTEVDQTM